MKIEYDNNEVSLKINNTILKQEVGYSNKSNYPDKNVTLFSFYDLKYDGVFLWDLIRKLNKKELPKTIHFEVLATKYHTEIEIIERLPYPFYCFDIGTKNDNYFIRFETAILELSDLSFWNKEYTIEFFLNAFSNLGENDNIKIIKQRISNDGWSLTVEISKLNSDILEDAAIEGILILEQLINKIELSFAGFNKFLNFIEIWDKNINNNDEKFWQSSLFDNPWIISFIFNQPFLIFRNEGYLGGKNIGNKKGKVVDFIYKNKLTNNVTLIEIKTPTSKIIGRKYRNTFTISTELNGAISQLIKYRDTIQKEYYTLRGNSINEFNFFNTKGVIIIGNMNSLNQKQRQAFELYRNELKNVEIITFDELVEKVIIALSLINKNIQNKESYAMPPVHSSSDSVQQ